MPLENQHMSPTLSRM